MNIYYDFLIESFLYLLNALCSWVPSSSPTIPTSKILIYIPSIQRMMQKECKYNPCRSRLSRFLSCSGWKTRIPENIPWANDVYRIQQNSKTINKTYPIDVKWRCVSSRISERDARLPNMLSWILYRPIHTIHVQSTPHEPGSAMGQPYSAAILMRISKRMAPSQLAELVMMTAP
jgi:hypothetical protein